MRTHMTSGKLTASWVVMALALAAAAAPAHAQSDEASMEIYGFAMLDMGYQFKQNDPNWFDVVRPTKLPASEDQFGEDGHFYSGVRQSRLGVKSTLPTEIGDLKTTFEFELFGVGVDQGQTTFRLRHAYGELGKWGAGQTWSPFMDIDVFPNSIEYWGPTGMAFYRNVQFRYMPIQGDSRLTFALERPGASGDLGEFRGGVPDETNLQGHFPAPDVSAEYRMGHGWGYLEAAAIWRYMEWDDLDGTGPDLSGSEIGWGVNLSSNIIMDTANDANDVIRLQVLYGEGVENYMNDAPADVAAIATNDPAHPLDGEALPVLGAVAFLDHYWSDGWSTSVGYSMIDIDNSEGQAADAFKRGHYALANLLHYPAKNVMIGGEFQWGRRENNSDGWEADDYRFQLSARYNFGHTFGGM